MIIVTFLQYCPVERRKCLIVSNLLWIDKLKDVRIGFLKHYVPGEYQTKLIKLFKKKRNIMLAHQES